MVFLNNCNNLSFWQIYLPDPASIIMEGILIFNKHLFFLLCVIVLFVAWLLFYTIFYCMEYTNKLKMTCVLWVQTVILLLISVFPSKNFLGFREVDVVVTLDHLTEIKDIVSRTRGPGVWGELQESSLNGGLDVIPSDDIDSVRGAFMQLKAYLPTTNSLRNIPINEISQETDIGRQITLTDECDHLLNLADFYCEHSKNLRGDFLITNGIRILEKAELMSMNAGSSQNIFLRQGDEMLLETAALLLNPLFTSAQTLVLV